MTCLLVVRNATLNCYLEKTFFVNNVFHISTRKLVFPNKRPKTSSLTRVYIFIRSITFPRCSAIRFSVLKTRLIRVLYLQRAYVHGPRFDRSFIFFSSFLFTVKLLPLLLWIHTSRGLIALDTFYDYFNFVLLSLCYEYLPNILRTGSTVFTYRVYSEHSPIPEVSYPPSLRHLFEQKVRRLGRYSIFLSFVPKGWEESPFYFSFSPLSNFHWTNVSIRGSL